MEERLFPHLLKNEPGVEELTKEQYENYRGIEQAGPSSPNTEDVGGNVATDPETQAESSVPGTKAQITEVLKERGFTSAQLRGKNKQDLIDLL